MTNYHNGAQLTTTEPQWTSTDHYGRQRTTTDLNGATTDHNGVKEHFEKAIVIEFKFILQ